MSEEMAAEIYYVGKEAPLGRSFNSCRWLFHQSLLSRALPALVLLGQRHEGLPLADSVLPSSCSTENPDFKHHRSLFSSVGRLCPCLLVSQLLPTASTTHRHSETPGHQD